MKFTTTGLLIGAARSAVAGMAFVFTFGFTPTVLAQEEATDPTEEAAPAEAVETIPVESTEAAAAAPAAEGATELDTIEVTGSRIKRSDYETAQPILVISREDIEKTGMVSIGDILQNLPQAGAALSRAFNNGGTGETNIDLRNLGANRVLVLVNGRRWVSTVNSFNTGAVDLNTIPISIIDSIEVLKDGASAIYGSDAIAGVVNIKTRRDYVGAEVRGHIEATEKGDGLSELVSFSGGTVAGKTSVFFDVSYVNQGELQSADRKQSRVPTFGMPEDNFSRGSRFVPNNNTIFIPTPQNAQAINTAAGFPQGGLTSPCPDISSLVTEVPLPVGSTLTLCDLVLDPVALAGGSVEFIRMDVNQHQYNYAPVNYLITPSERTSIFGQLSHQLFDQVRFSSEVLYNVRKSTQQLAETPDGLGDLLGFKPFDWGYVASDNPYNPTNPESPYYIAGTEAQDIGKADSGSGLVGLGAVLKRFYELGPRVFNQNVDTMRIAGGFDGSFDYFDRFFSWDAGFAFGENKLADINYNLINNERLARASGPIADCTYKTVVEDPTGEVGNTTLTNPPAAGCVPFDWFGGPGSATPEMLKYLRYDAIDVSKQRQRIAYANMSTEVGELSQWLAGPLGLAFGVEYRDEFFMAQPDPLKVALASSTNSVGPTRGGYDVIEGYMELRVPVLADKPFVKDLEVSVAGRYSQYSSFGDNLSGKLGVRYKPLDDLILRSTVSNAFRAPAVTDLFLGQAVSFPVVDDPCTTPANDTVQANCEADGAAGATQTTSQIPTVFGGNPDLQPETATTLSAGFVYSPSFLPDFNFYLDWYKVDAEDFIDAIDPEDVLQFCYEADQRSFCDAVHRNSAGQLTQIDAVFQNFSRFEVEGVDFNFDWILPLPQMVTKFVPGAFQWTLDAAYVTKLNRILPTPDGGERTQALVGEEDGGSGGAPRWKVNTGLNWHMGEWEAAWNLRYIHHLWEPCDDGRGDPGAQGVLLENPVPVLTFEQFGLCSDPNSDRYAEGNNHGVLADHANELKATFYNDVQAGYSLPNWNTRLTLGVNNVLGQDPPRAVSSFADSYDKATYDPWGSRTPYLRVQVNF